MMQTSEISSHELLHIEPKLDSRTKARETAQQFEQIFVQMMLAGMRKTSELAGGDGLFGDGPGNDTYTQWFDNSMAEYLSNNGHLGIADTLMREFERWHQIPPEPTEDAPPDREDGAVPKERVDVAA
jgi:Rod binding domain-containing protein